MLAKFRNYTCKVDEYDINGYVGQCFDISTKKLELQKMAGHFVLNNPSGPPNGGSGGGVGAGGSGTGGNGP